MTQYDTTSQRRQSSGQVDPDTVAQVAKASTSAAAEQTTEPPQPSPSPTQPRTRAGVRMAAQKAFDLYSSGQYGRFRDRWSSGAQELVSRRDYMRRFKECLSPVSGLRFEITDVAVSGDTAKVTASRSVATFIFDFAYQRGAWRYVPFRITFITCHTLPEGTRMIEEDVLRTKPKWVRYLCLMLVSSLILTLVAGFYPANRNSSENVKQSIITPAKEVDASSVVIEKDQTIDIETFSQLAEQLRNAGLDH
ncbi:nuclear transport factor 2 family protein [Microbispora sp. RL4-1S]|uniref:Nuclear transport factor 2 family protein n=1 Tax=Microbispora oryzae TaxID=2806554 RepID=A0A940WG89_9ACTN|nr:nuclear transport factor 2 family protein [Microbispora oryzae]MBP2704960.1 nuclear transport factor 2 family protein [Microbispora oryzae]